MQMKIYIITVIVLFCVSCGNKQNVSESNTTEIEYSQIPIPEIMDERIKQMYSTDDISAFEKEIELAYNDDMSVYNTSSDFIDSLFVIEKDSLLHNHGGFYDYYNRYNHSKYYSEIEKDIFRTKIVSEYMSYNKGLLGDIRFLIYGRQSHLKLIDKYYHILLTELDDETKKYWLKIKRNGKKALNQIIFLKNHLTFPYWLKMKKNGKKVLNQMII